jgi:ABC-type multidrug transport system fused ATPase/permease subunit
MIAKDKRTKAANELFFSIKFIKMNALEDFFIKRLTALRDKEMAILMRRFAFQGLNIMSIWISPVLVVNATFAMYILMGNNLNPGNAFAMISLFQVLSGPLMALPMIINSLIEAMISMKRI